MTKNREKEGSYPLTGKTKNRCGRIKGNMPGKAERENYRQNFHLSILRGNDELSKRSAMLTLQGTAQTVPFALRKVQGIQTKA